MNDLFRFVKFRHGPTDLERNVLGCFFAFK